MLLSGKGALFPPLLAKPALFDLPSINHPRPSSCRFNFLHHPSLFFSSILSSTPAIPFHPPFVRHFFHSVPAIRAPPTRSCFVGSSLRSHSPPRQRHRCERLRRRESGCKPLPAPFSKSVSESAASATRRSRGSS